MVRRLEALPRSKALWVLTRVLSDHQALDEALALALPEVSPERRPWLQDVCSGTLRWKGRLDLAIDAAALKKKPTGWLRKALLIGAYQLIGQERREAALVVSESVDWIRAKEGGAPAGFANAVLRRIAEQADHWRDAQAPKELATDAGAAWASFSPWLWQRLLADHGKEWGVAFSQAALKRPVLWLRLAPGASPPGEDVEGPVEHAWEAPTGGPLQAWEGFEQGRWIVQDISSQLLVQEVVRQLRKRGLATGRALDLCSAPGGKAIGLAWEGFDVDATDLSEARLKKVVENAKRTMTEGRVHAIPKSEISGVYDLVWVDAPCSGSGIVRRHPDVRWNFADARALTSLLASQAQVFEEGWERVRPGGFFVYSVCSVIKAEGPELLQAMGEKLAGVQAPLAQWSLAPHEPPYGDGFWACLLQKA